MQVIELSRSRPEDSSTAEERVVADFEALLRRGYPAGSLQDRFARSLEWLEGNLVTPSLVEAIQAKARRELRSYLEEGHLPLLMLRARELANELTVTHDGQGHLTIELPAEVRRCLQQATPSMISF